MVEDLKGKAAKGILWTFLDQGGTQLLQFISGIYIARILSPDDYGLVGMMAIFLAISQVFIDSGFKATLIQKGQEVTQDDYNVVFYFNVGVSTLIYLLIFIGANQIAAFFHETRLVPVARIIGLNLIFSSLGIVHTLKFEKRLNFKTTTKIKLVGITVSIAAGIVLAVMGFGVWSLVIMALVETFTRTVLLWFILRWYPTLSFKMKVFKSLFADSSKLLLSSIFYQLNANIFSFVIGKIYTTSDVGFYSQGKKLQQRIGDFIVYSIYGVMFPVHSLIKEDLPRLRNSVRKNVKVTTLISFPAIIGLMAIAEPFVLLFLTEKWLPSVFYIHILSLAGLFFAISGSVNSYVIPIGKFNLALFISIFNSTILAAYLILGVVFKLSLEHLMYGKVFQDVVNFVLAVYFSKRLISYGILRILKDAAPAIVFSLIMGAVVYLIGEQFGFSFTVLTVQVVGGALVYLTLNLLFNRVMVKEVFDFAKSLKPGYKNN